MTRQTYYYLIALGHQSKLMSTRVAMIVGLTTGVGRVPSVLSLKTW